MKTPEDEWKLAGLSGRRNGDGVSQEQECDEHEGNPAPGLLVSSLKSSISSVVPQS